MNNYPIQPKVLVIFPRFNASDATHYPYWYSLFNEAGKQLELAILFESGAGSADYFSHLRSIRVQRFQSKPLNLLERFILINNYIQAGYTDIYIHYSYWSVGLAWILKNTLFRSRKLTIYYWDCEKYEDKPKNIMLEIALRLTDVLVTGHEAVATAYRQVFNFTKPIKIVANWVEQVRGAKYGVLGSEFRVRGTGLESQTNKKFASHSAKSSALRTLHSAHVNILFVHHLSPRKGSRELPEIIKSTLARIPNAHFHIVGEGPDREWLRVRCAEFGLIDSVTFYGALTHEQTAELYKTADVFIMPSRSEGFPRVILEAMRYGLPIVSTPVGCVRELFGPHQRQFLCKPSQFPEKIMQLLTRADLETIGKENTNFVKKYSIANAAKAFTQLFTS
jgi:glycosyltransferase involved in cell wall biosynthesis